jgi:predicted DNA-binding transcriptional regulator AlpA
MHSTQAFQGRLLIPREAADWLQISQRSLWSLTNCDRALPAVRIGRSVRYRPEDLAAYCERLAGQSAEH